MTTRAQAYARYTQIGCSLLGKLINHGRKKRRMTQTDLADRLGITRSTVQRAEQGDPRVAVGIMFEAAAVVGVRLFDQDEKGLADLAAHIEDRIAVLPKYVRHRTEEVFDDF